MSSWSDVLIEGWIDDVEAMDKWVALFSSDPSAASDPLAVEIIGGAYVRVGAVWTRTGPNALTMTSAAVFRALAPGTSIAAAGVMTAATNGDLLFSDLLYDVDGNPTIEHYPSGGTYVIPSGQFVAGIDV
jgi:hypothetical protein